MRLKFYIPFAIFLISFHCVPAQKKTGIGNKNQQPKLVVGLVIDQMRWDYLYRFNSLYGNDGFKRLLSEGFSFENTMVPYTPTYTAPGHSCIYTGSVPALNGIIGNFWYDKRTGKSVYCTEDSTASTVGSKSNAGKMSPENMWTTTITDELRLSNNFRSRVFGISLKDRGAILPAGHGANAAYWFDASVGKWISSSHYMQALPDYVNGFNDRDLAGDYMKGVWNTLLPIENYGQSTADDKPYENPIPGLNTVNFPHQLSLITNDKYEAFKYTPFASTYTFDFARTVVENEQLGKKAVTDFLAISISSTDYAGHHFGPNSVEIEDTYARLDKDIASFLQYLDEKLGKGNYLLFLSADHAVAHIPGFLQEHEIPSAVFSNIEIKNELNKMVEKKYGLPRVIPSVQNYQVYVNKNAIAIEGKNEEAILKDIMQLLARKEFITDVVETGKINAASISQPQRERMINGYNAQRSGDIQFIVKSGYFDGANKGTTHGSWNPYDAHIPLLFYGWNVKPGKTNREVYMTDIAPTIAAMLQIQMPNGCVGKVLTEVSGN